MKKVRITNPKHPHYKARGYLVKEKEQLSLSFLGSMDRIRDMDGNEFFASIIRNMLRNQYHCTKPCGFYMSSEAFNRVVENLYTGKPIVEDEAEKNQRELNNL